MIKSWILLSILIVLLSCSTAIQTFQTSDTNKIGVKSSKFRGTIFKDSYQDLFVSPVSSHAKRFTPTNEDILLAETILKEQIEKVNTPRINQLKPSQYIDKNINKYFRQYLGYYNENGNRIIHINLAWDKFSIFDRIKGDEDQRLDFSSGYNFVQDGGSRYWNVNVDLTTKTLYGMSVNGEG